ncbi:hypothetical protein [Bacillus atrophaeus]|uniref:hypothetical protein n=1 Tax=Bacillus atrophaeus TaxID=1452 RepID=UPI002E143E0E
MLNYLRFITKKLDDEYKRLEVMPITGENDCLGLSKKTPDYEEAKGKETTHHEATFV